MDELWLLRRDGRLICTRNTALILLSHKLTIERMTIDTRGSMLIQRVRFADNTMADTWHVYHIDEDVGEPRDV